MKIRLLRWNFRSNILVSMVRVSHACASNRREYWKQIIEICSVMTWYYNSMNGWMKNRWKWLVVYIFICVEEQEGWSSPRAPAAAIDKLILGACVEWQLYSRTYRMTTESFKSLERRMAVTNSPQLQSTSNISRIPPSNMALNREVWKILQNNTRKQAFYLRVPTLDIESAQLHLFMRFRLLHLSRGEEIRSRNTSKMWPLTFNLFVPPTILSIIMSYPCPPHIHERSPTCPLIDVQYLFVLIMPWCYQTGCR